MKTSRNVLLIAISLSVGLGGCEIARKFLPKTTALVCENEQDAHDNYVKFIGPKRTAEQRAREQRAYERIMADCARTQPVPQQNIDAAAKARQ
jgi:hypothetical protein